MIDLGASTITGTLEVTAGGNITDSGNLSVTGETTLNANGNDITLDNANNFSTVAVANGRNVSLNDSNAIVLGASNINGTLDVIANGAITNSGSLNVTGDASFTTTLANAGNVYITNSNFNGTVIGDSLIGGNFTLDSTGNVTQTGALKVAGTAQINDAPTVTLNNQNNVLPLLTTNNGDVIFTKVGSIELGTEPETQNVIGNLTVNSQAQGEEFIETPLITINAIAILNENRENSLFGASI